LYSCVGADLKALENVWPSPVAEVGVLGEKDEESVDAPRGAFVGGLNVEGVTALESSEDGEKAGGTTDNGVYLEVAPVSRSTTRRVISLLDEKNSSASKLGSRLGAGGKMSDWNESAFRGTTKAIGSIVPADGEVVIL
jgi:hypothetical protein